MNDDGEVHALTDALALLRWEFDGGDAPPDPGTKECGPDPEPDGIGCRTQAEVCK